MLSESTEQYDRGLTWDGYQRIESLTDYLLVSQAEARIEHFRRDRNRTWVYQLAGVGERLTLSSGVELDVDAIFAGVMQLPGDRDRRLLPARLVRQRQDLHAAHRDVRERADRARLVGDVQYRSVLAITSFMISRVPPPIGYSRASRYSRSTRVSRM